MNTETGALYQGLEAIQAAEARGEPIVRVSDRVAKAVRIGLERMTYDQAKAYHRKRGRIGKKRKRGVDR